VKTEPASMALRRCLAAASVALCTLAAAPESGATPCTAANLNFGGHLTCGGFVTGHALDGDGSGEHLFLLDAGTGKDVTIHTCGSTFDTQLFVFNHCPSQNDGYGFYSDNGGINCIKSIVSAPTDAFIGGLYLEGNNYVKVTGRDPGNGTFKVYATCDPPSQLRASSPMSQQLSTRRQGAGVGVVVCMVVGIAASVGLALGLSVAKAQPAVHAGEFDAA